MFKNGYSLSCVDA